MSQAFALTDVEVKRDGAAILDGVTLGLEAGGVLAVVGPSGGGKSHLLRVINGLTEISGGAVEVLGKPIDAWSPRALRRRVGWVSQRPALTPGTVAEIVATAERLNIVDARQLAARREVAYRVAGIDENLAGRARDRLSAGERQRAAIARALVCEPEILLCDEPTSSLDGDAGARLLERLRAWAGERGASLAVVTHRIEDLGTLGAEPVVIDGGRVVDRDRDEIVRLLTGREGA